MEELPILDVDVDVYEGTYLKQVVFKVQGLETGVEEESLG